MSPMHPQNLFTLFPTSIGTCGIAWSARGIVAVQLPESDPQSTRARLQRTQPQSRPGRAPPVIQRVIDDITALLAGERRDLGAALLDMTGTSDFQHRVYAATRTIAPGQTLSYAQVASLCGDAKAARAVGRALGCNPFPIIVPCHRVLAAGGKSGGFSAYGGVTTKLRLLQLEGAAPALATRRSALEPSSPALPF